MPSMISALVHRCRDLPGRAYLLAAVLIYATSNSVTRKLTEIGAQHLIDGRNPISFCNVLFVGNLCALIALVTVYHRQLHKNVIRKLSRRNWIGLMGIALLSGALAPALIFAALQTTTVNTVILIGRIEPPLILVLSILVLKSSVNRWVIAGALVSFLGVGITILLQPPQSTMMPMGPLSLGLGELLTAGWAVTAAIASILSKVTLQDVPLGLFNLVKNAIGTVVFFFIALIIYGPEHFMDVTTPILWQWMALYGAVIVVGGQLFWFAGLKRSNASEVSLASSFNPIAGMIAAFLILGEVPTQAHYFGGFVILIGIALNQIGLVRQPRATQRPALSVSEEMNLSSSVGFKGL